jgi:hypothetical protein
MALYLVGLPGRRESRVTTSLEPSSSVSSTTRSRRWVPWIGPPPPRQLMTVA